MATEHTRERDALAPLHEGDFQRIPGIGPGIAQRLHAAGIETFRQLAALSPEEIYAQLNGLVGMTSERIAHQDWPGKAQQLAEEIAAALPTAEPIPEREEPGERQHYASFMIELLQDENHFVRRTRVVHVQNGEKDSWAGWDPGRLDGWITAQAAIAQPALHAEVKPPKPRELVAALRLGQGEVRSADGEALNRFLAAGQPFTVRLPLEVEIERRPAAGLRYVAAVQARQVSANGQRTRAGQVEGLFDPEGERTLDIPVEGLEEGVYRLETSMLVYPEGAAEPENEGSATFAEGGLVYVYAREAELAA